MALFRHVGDPVTIAPGATHYWEYWFGGGDEVGVALVTPNLLDSDINIELIASDHGVVLVQAAGENPPMTHYTVRVRNGGPIPMTYDLNTGNLL
jgi:hypothetical protein